MRIFKSTAKMKNPQNFYITVLFFSFLFFAAHSAKSQNIDEIRGKWRSAPLKVDGKADIAVDSLSNFNENTGFSFEISNDEKNLYMAIKSHNKTNLNKILNKGITFSVNTEGKKKPGASILFPVLEPAGQQLANKPNSSPDEAMRKQTLSRIRQFKVAGFAEILDGPISLQNTYGLEAAAGFESEDLYIEIQIPLALLDIPSRQEALACLIEINGIKPPKQVYNPNQYPRRNRRYGGYDNRPYDIDRGPSIDRNLLPTGFWVKVPLATNPEI